MFLLPKGRASTILIPDALINVGEIHTLSWSSVSAPGRVPDSLSEIFDATQDPNGWNVYVVLSTEPGDHEPWESRATIGRTIVDYSKNSEVLQSFWKNIEVKFKDLFKKTLEDLVKDEDILKKRVNYQI